MAAVLPIWRLAHCPPVTSTVRVAPPLTTIASVEFGWPPVPDPPVRVLQALLVLTVMVAALATIEAPRSATKSASSSSVSFDFMRKGDVWGFSACVRWFRVRMFIIF